MSENPDTICAVSTPPGLGGIGVVRLSGIDAVGVAMRIFRQKGNKVGFRKQSHRIYYGHVVNPGTGEVADEALVSVMLAPRTYTREDVVEINCHGGPVAVRKVLGLAVSAGARLAEPGEFTKRAFLNGRIDLTQAEAVMDVIASRTELSLQAAMGQLSGGLGKKVEAVREQLIELLALTEVSIDFPEEEIDYVPLDGLRERGQEARAGITALLDGFDSGRVLREGLRVAIIGRPNVGKSSLLNLLARSERAIVTEVPGTTRDTVEEQINLGGLPVVVVDTAGIRQSRDVVEREGIRRSEEAMRRADLVLLVVDGSLGLSPEDVELAEKVKKNNYLPVINKSDLPCFLNEEGLIALFGADAPVRISARTGDGLEGLTRRVKDKVGAGLGERTPEAAINLRHKDALERALEALARFDEGCEDGLSEEFLAVLLREALDAVGEIAGTTAPEAILDKIFNDFCIGK